MRGVVQEMRFTGTEGQKGRKVCLQLENGEILALYRSEIRSLTQEERLLLCGNGALPDELCRKLVGIVTLRAKKRALHLLERMDRTEHQLREKLRRDGYPEECVEDAIGYAQQLHYIDDLRYARNYVQCHQGKKSRQRLAVDLLRRGIPRERAAQALDDEFAADETAQIRALLERRHYDGNTADERTKRRTYRFLLGRGFQSSNIFSVMGERLWE